MSWLFKILPEGKRGPIHLSTSFAGLFLLKERIA